MLAMHRVLLLAALCCGTAAAGFDPIKMVKGWIGGLMGSAADAAKETACDNAISPVLDELEENAKKQVDAQCKPMAEQSDLLGRCCSKQGEKIATEPVATQRDSLKDKCMAIEKVSAIASQMKAALVGAKTQLEADIKSVPQKMSEALTECEAKATVCKDAISPVFDPIVKKLEQLVDEECKPMAEKSDLLGQCCSAQGETIATEPVATQRDGLRAKCMAIEKVSDIAGQIKAALTDAKTQLEADIKSVPQKMKDALSDCAGKGPACNSVISPVLDSFKKELEQLVEDQCKPMKEKSDQIGACCESKGGDIMSTPVDNQQELLMGKCTAIDSVSDIPRMMKAAIKEAADTFKKDVQAVPQQLKDATSSCADEAIHTAVEDTASDVTQNAIDTVKDTASDAMENALGQNGTKEDGSNGESESKFEVHGRVSPPTGLPLAAQAALVFVSLLVFTTVVMGRCRRRKPVVELSEREVSSLTVDQELESVDQELEALLEE